MTRLLEIPAPFSVASEMRPSPPADRRKTPRQLAQFSVVGVLNTGIDVAVLNVLLWLFAWHSTPLLLMANAIAYTMGAINSFLLNRFWTFDQRRRVTGGEVWRFVGLTIGGLGFNELLLWLATRALMPVLGDTWITTNLAKGVAICGTLGISYLGMRLWVFAQRQPQSSAPSYLALHDAGEAKVAQRELRLVLSHVLAHHGISVVLPAYNEEQVIASTLTEVLSTLADWGADFEVIVVDDGSADRTHAIVADMAQRDGHIHLIAHSTNQGYGAALADGFAAATKDLTFFMDSDGQFTIHDLARLLIKIDVFDAVIGYRIARQDAWLRKVNAWGWNRLVRLVLGVQARDLDCAFKVFRTAFLQVHPLESRGAMINAELLYKLKRADKTYGEVGVHHLPRHSGRATGARPSVILRAMRELWISSLRWRREAHNV